MTLSNTKDENGSAEAVVRAYWDIMISNQFERLPEVLSADFVLEYPQSNERLRGPQRYVKLNKEYPAQGLWHFTVHRLVASSTEVVTDVSVTDGSIQARALSFFTVDRRTIVKLVEFWPEDYPAPSNRAHLVESLNPR